MKVKNLIKQLMEFPMDSEIVLGIKKENVLNYGKGKFVIVDYENDEVGILSIEERRTNEN